MSIGGRQLTRRDWAVLLVMFGVLILWSSWTPFQQDRALAVGADTVMATLDTVYSFEHRAGLKTSRVDREYHFIYRFPWRGAQRAGRFELHCDPRSPGSCAIADALARLDTLPVLVARAHPERSRPLAVPDEHNWHLGLVIAGFLCFPVALFLWRQRR